MRMSDWSSDVCSSDLPLPGADGYSFAFTWQHRGEIVAAWHCLIGVPPCGAFRFCFLLACLLPVARHPPLPAARLPPRRMKTKPWHRPKARETEIGRAYV